MRQPLRAPPLWRRGSRHGCRGDRWRLRLACDEAALSATGRVVVSLEPWPIAKRQVALAVARQEVWVTTDVALQFRGGAGRWPGRRRRRWSRRRHQQRWRRRLGARMRGRRWRRRRLPRWRWQGRACTREHRRWLWAHQLCTCGRPAPPSHQFARQGLSKRGPHERVLAAARRQTRAPALGGHSTCDGGCSDRGCSLWRAADARRLDLGKRWRLAWGVPEEWNLPGAHLEGAQKVGVLLADSAPVAVRDEERLDGPR